MFVEAATKIWGRCKESVATLWQLHKVCGKYVSVVKIAKRLGFQQKLSSCIQISQRFPTILNSCLVISYYRLRNYTRLQDIKDMGKRRKNIALFLLSRFYSRHKFTFRLEYDGQHGVLNFYARRYRISAFVSS